MFTIKLKNTIQGTFVVSGLCIDPSGQIIEVYHEVEILEDAKFLLDSYSDNAGYECRRIIEINDYPTINENIATIRRFIFGN